ncbi:MAG TPA: hypothetical protein VIQ31_06910, partial [Phormidium sp.]
PNRARYMKAEHYLKYNILVELMEIVKTHGRKPDYRFRFDKKMSLIKNGPHGLGDKDDKIKTKIAIDSFMDIWLLTLPEKFEEWFLLFLFPSSKTSEATAKNVFILNEKPEFPVFSTSSNVLVAHPNHADFTFLPKSWNLKSAFEFYLSRKAQWTTKSIEEEFVELEKERREKVQMLPLSATAPNAAAAGVTADVTGEIVIEDNDDDEGQDEDDDDDVNPQLVVVDDDDDDDDDDKNSKKNNNKDSGEETKDEPADPLAVPIPRKKGHDEAEGQAEAESQANAKRSADNITQPCPTLINISVDKSGEVKVDTGEDNVGKEPKTKKAKPTIPTITIPATVEERMNKIAMDLHSVTVEAQTLQDHLKEGPLFEGAKSLNEHVVNILNRLNGLCQFVANQKKK